MREPSAYRLLPSRSAPAVYDLFDRETGQLVGVAYEEKAVQSGSVGGILNSWARRSRLFAAAAMTIAAIRACIYGLGVLFGLTSIRPAGPRPRLVVQRPDGGEIVFSLRVSSGMMYESRRVDDGKGEPLARFRSHFKTGLRTMGFGMIDLRGPETGSNDDRQLPRFGRVCRVEDGIFCVNLVDRGDVGRIVEHGIDAGPDVNAAGARPAAGYFDVDAGLELQGEATGKILLLAAALTVAWRPPPG